MGTDASADMGTYRGRREIIVHIRWSNYQPWDPFALSDLYTEVECEVIERRDSTTHLSSLGGMGGLWRYQPRFSPDLDSQGLQTMEAGIYVTVATSGTKHVFSPTQALATLGGYTFLTTVSALIIKQVVLHLIPDRERYKAAILDSGDAYTELQIQAAKREAWHKKNVEHAGKVLHLIP